MDKGVGDMLSSTQVEKVDISAQADKIFRSLKLIKISESFYSTRMHNQGC